MSEERTFVWVPVQLTEKEYAALRREACLTGPGTVSSAIRQAMNKSQSPFGASRPHRVVSEQDYWAEKNP